MQELLTEEEQRELQNLFSEFADAGQDDDDSDSDTESVDSDESDDIDDQGNLKDFIVNDEEEDDSENELEAGGAIKDEEADADADAQEGVAGPSKKIPKGKGKAKEVKKPKKPAKKGKGKKEKQPKKKKSTITLAELKKLSTRNKNARKTYMRRIRKDWMSSAKIDKTMEILKGIMDTTDEKVLIFSQWTSLLDLLEVPIDQEDWGYRRYDGSMNPKMRGDAVDDFRDPKKGKFT